jgi:hypothetical protein
MAMVRICEVILGQSSKIQCAILYLHKLFNLLNNAKKVDALFLFKISCILFRQRDTTLTYWREMLDPVRLIDKLDIVHN